MSEAAAPPAQGAPAAGDWREAVRETLRQAHAGIVARFDGGEAIERLLAAETASVDVAVRQAWAAALPTESGLDLLATGGYGRGEQYPFSDVDLLVLGPAEAQRRHEAALGAFFAALWDIGLKPGTAVRSLADCVQACREDVGTLTALTEARLLAGSPAAPERLEDALRSEGLWPAAAYFDAKRAEWAARHARYHDTAYNLEPNLKEGPGALRDLHTLGWLARRIYRVPGLEALVPLGLLGADEAATLRRDWRTLARLRFGLHLVAGRREERLRFDYQKPLAARLGYRDEASDNLAVEQMMQAFFRAAHTVQRISERVLQRFEEQLAGRVERVPVAPGFERVNGYLRREAPGPVGSTLEAFALFATWAACPEAKGLHSETARALAEALPRIAPYEAQDADTRAAFLSLLQGPQPVETLARMAHLGVLGRYLPAFARVSGRMQYDLFHVYTVDQHTLEVLRIMAGFPEGRDERFPRAKDVHARLKAPWLLLVAGLFHDIAKGRGGDHSLLGAEDVRAFALAHRLKPADTALLAWLVEQHLLMSTTAQRQDISDVAVVERFAAAVGDRTRLDYLYLLTCADIAGTSPKLWNTWKERLLSDLYESTRLALRRGLEHRLDAAERVAEVQAEVRALLADLPLEAVERAFAEFPAESFLRYRPEQLATQARAVLGHADRTRPLVLVRPQGEAYEVFVHSPDRDGLFATITATLDRLGFSVAVARIVTSTSGMSLDTFQLLPLHDTGEPPEARARHAERVITEMLMRPAASLHPPRRALPAALKHFRVPPKVELRALEDGRRTQLVLIGTDRPGLLADMARILREHGLRVHDARIATFGERAEDLFLISDEADRALADPDAIARLTAALTACLEGDRPHAPSQEPRHR
ncbi:[protein-PII] uridylyltransferase [Silanimonas lenta]|uniref:[protein-PII] uridylyltransferase n=1 Tax=Silanimonas lenta TaxID=265429 RepID=UPI002FE1B51A